MFIIIVSAKMPNNSLCDAVCSNIVQAVQYLKFCFFNTNRQQYYQTNL